MKSLWTVPFSRSVWARDLLIFFPFVSRPAEYTTQKKALLIGPLPSLAELQARHEQRLNLTSPISKRYIDSATTSVAANQSRNPSLETVEPSGLPLLPQSPALDFTPNPTEKGVKLQRQISERQEARTNLIRKLSKGRSATAAGGGTRNRTEVSRQTFETTTGLSPKPASPTLQGRPSLAEALAEAESRQLATGPSAVDKRNEEMSYTSMTSGLNALFPKATLPIVEAAQSENSYSMPVSTLAQNNLSSGSYSHIPVPPLPESSSLTSSPRRMNQTHESVYSTASDFKSYRHTTSRDRDSAIARFGMENNFEFEFDEEGQGQGQGDVIASPSEKLLRSKDVEGNDLSHASLPKEENLEATFFSPPDSPIDAKMIPGRQQDLLATTSVTKRMNSHLGSTTPLQNLEDGLPVTPDSMSPTSPISPFTFSSLGILSQQSAFPAQTQQQASTASTGNSRYDRHEAHASTDSFPVSVATSHSSRNPQSMAFLAHESLPFPENLSSSSRARAGQTNIDTAALDVQTEPLTIDRMAVGPPADYRFPTPIVGANLSRLVQPVCSIFHIQNVRILTMTLQRPASRASESQRDGRMDSLIEELEAMQAADLQEKPKEQPR